MTKEELEKENIMLESQIEGEKEYSSSLNIRNISFEKQLIKAKGIIQELVHEISVFYIATNRIVVSPTVKQAEKFLKEVKG